MNHSAILTLSSTLYLCFSLLSLTAHGQDTLSPEVARRHAYFFSLDRQSINGPGWDSLKKELRQSQFVALGENHYSPLLSLFTMHFLNEAGKAGYRHFMLETGPIAARKVSSMYSPDENLFRKRMHNWLSTYKLDVGSPPSEFVTMKNDIPMLQAALQHKFNIIGLDKEYYSSLNYLLEELKKYCTAPALKAAHTAALQQATGYQQKAVADEEFGYISHCKSDTSIQILLSLVNTQSPEAASIVTEIRKSFRIYGLYEDKQYYQSEEVRIANIKQNLGKYYAAHSGKDPSLLKAVLKFGNMHSQRGMSFLQHFDVGNSIAELAALNGERSIHIHCMRRYRKNEQGEVMDFYNQGYEVYANFISLTDTARWLMVDLRPIRLLMMTKKLKVNRKEERDLIMQNDLLLLIPTDGAYKESLNYE